MNLNVIPVYKMKIQIMSLYFKLSMIYKVDESS